MSRSDRVIAAHPAVRQFKKEGDKMKTRVMFLIFVGLLIVGCGGRVEVTGVESKTLMNGKHVYYAHTDCGTREITQGVYVDLAYKLNHLARGKTLMCDMEKASGVWDMAICFQDVIAVGVLDTNKDAEEYGQ